MRGLQTQKGLLIRQTHEKSRIGITAFQLFFFEPFFNFSNTSLNDDRKKRDSVNY